MDGILTQGLDEANLILPVGPDSYCEVSGFNGQLYLVGAEAGVLSVATEISPAEQLDLSYSQLVVARFALEHVGAPFRGSEIVDIGGLPLRKDEFNAAVFDKESGLWGFFNDVAGYNMLWHRDRNVHQLGEAYELDDGAETLESADAPQMPGDELAPLSDEQQTIIDAVRDIVPRDGIGEDELINQLCDLYPEYMTAQVKALLHSAVHIIRNHAGEQTFGFATRGKGAQKTRVFQMDRSLSTAPEELAPQGKKVGPSQTPKEPRPPTPNHPKRYSSLAQGKKAIGSNTVRRASHSTFDAEASRAEKLPVAWDLTEGGMVVDGEFVEVHPDILKLIDVISQAGNMNTWLGDVAVIYNGARMTEEQFNRFVVWANIVIDEVNSIAPVIVVNNRGRAGRRDNQTFYKYNKKGDWASVTDIVAGTSLIPYSIED